MKQIQQLFFVQEGWVNKNGHQWREGKSDKTSQVVLMSTTCSLFLHCLLPEQRAMETPSSTGLRPPLIFKTPMHMKGNSFICDASCDLSPRSSKFPFFVPLELKWFLCANFSLPRAHLSPLELGDILSIQCDLRKPGVTNKDKLDSFFFFFQITKCKTHWQLILISQIHWRNL